MTAIMRFLLLTVFIATISAHITQQNIPWESFAAYKRDPLMANAPAGIKDRSQKWDNNFSPGPGRGQTLLTLIKVRRGGVPMAYMALMKQMNSAFSNDPFFL